MGVGPEDDLQEEASGKLEGEGSDLDIAGVDGENLSFVPAEAPLKRFPPISPDGEPLDDVQVSTGALAETLWIDMVELGSGCAGDCLSCGAFEGVSPEDRKVKPITLDQFIANITQEVSGSQNGTRLQIHQLFRSFVTTGVDMEPLRPGIFNEAAEALYEITGGRSRFVEISHGLTCVEKIVDGKPQYAIIPSQIEKLEKSTELLLQDKIPLFVLSMDSARMQGLPGKTARTYHEEVCEMEKPGSPFMRIIDVAATEDQRVSHVPKFGENKDLWEARKLKVRRALTDEVSRKIGSGVELDEREKIIAKYIDVRSKRRDSVVEVNARGYARTLYTLIPAIRAGKMVTISLQGDNNKDSLAYQGLARRILQRSTDLLREEHGLSNADVNTIMGSISVQPPRDYVGVGRAKNMLGVKPGGYCTVIPDPDFVKNFMDQDQYRVSRGRLTGDGTLKIQANRPDRTYNDTVDPKGNPWAVVNLAQKKVTEAAKQVTRVDLAATSLGRRVGVLDEASNG